MSSLPAHTRLLFIDESGVNTSLTRDYARSPKGTRATDSAPFVRGEKLSMIGAISLDDFECIMTIDGSVDGRVFEVFTREMLAPKLKEGDIVVLDNLRVHYNKKAKEIIEEKGAKLVFLPPYSPELNPIELAWSKIKALLKKYKARTREALDSAIAAAIDKITRGDLANWYHHCMSFNQKT